MNCQSCGMPMAQDSDHGGNQPNNPYCKYCTDPAGNLKTREEVREGMINFHMQSVGKTREEAEKEVDSHMAQMPAWRTQNEESTVAESSSPLSEPVVSVQEPTVVPPVGGVQDDLGTTPPPAPVADENVQGEETAVVPEVPAEASQPATTQEEPASTSGKSWQEPDRQDLGGGSQPED